MYLTQEYWLYVRDAFAFLLIPTQADVMCRDTVFSVDLSKSIQKRICEINDNHYYLQDALILILLIKMLHTKSVCT